MWTLKPFPTQESDLREVFSSGSPSGMGMGLYLQAVVCGEMFSG
jgi:hypothetical protein